MGAILCLALGAQIIPTPLYLFFYFYLRVGGCFFFFFLILATEGGSFFLFPNSAEHPKWGSYNAGPYLNLFSNSVGHPKWGCSYHAGSFPNPAGLVQLCLKRCLL